MGKLYQVLRTVLYPILAVKRIEYAEPLGDEPCIFLANHLGAVGPMYMAVTSLCGIRWRSGATTA